MHVFISLKKHSCFYPYTTLITVFCELKTTLQPRFDNTSIQVKDELVTLQIPLTRGKVEPLPNKAPHHESMWEQEV